MLNFTQVFKDVCSLTSLAVLEQYPSPRHILQADHDELISLIKRTSKMGLKWATTKYDLLCSKAKDFKPLSLDTVSNLTMLSINITMIRTLTDSLKSTITAIYRLLEEDAAKDTPNMSLIIELLCSIPGIGLITAATILAEVRDFSVFSKPDKLTAFFGIDPSVKQSGNFEGTRNKMSKRGAKLLRRVIFTIALVNVSKKCNGKLHNPVLHEFYKSKCKSKPKMVAMGAVMHKLVYIIYAVIRDKKPFVLRPPEEHARMLKAKALTA
jgi:endonuclease III